MKEQFGVGHDARKVVVLILATNAVDVLDAQRAAGALTRHHQLRHALTVGRVGDWLDGAAQRRIALIDQRLLAAGAAQRAANADQIAHQLHQLLLLLEHFGRANDGGAHRRCRATDLVRHHAVELVRERLEAGRLAAAAGAGALQHCVDLVQQALAFGHLLQRQHAQRRFDAARRDARRHAAGQRAGGVAVQIVDQSLQRRRQLRRHAIVAVASAVAPAAAATAVGAAQLVAADVAAGQRDGRVAFLLLLSKKFVVAAFGGGQRAVVTRLETTRLWQQMVCFPKGVQKMN